MLVFCKNYNEFNKTLNLFNKIYVILTLLSYKKTTNATKILSSKWEKVNNIS